MTNLTGPALLSPGQPAGAAAPALPGAVPLLAGVALPEAGAPQAAVASPPFAAMLAAQPAPGAPDQSLVAGMVPGDAAPVVPIDGAPAGDAETDAAVPGPYTDTETDMDLATPAPWLLQLVPELANLPAAIAAPPRAPAASGAPWPSSSQTTAAARPALVAGGRGWQASLPAAPGLKAPILTSAGQPAPQVASAPTISSPVVEAPAETGRPPLTPSPPPAVSAQAPPVMPPAVQPLSSVLAAPPMPGAVPVQPMVPASPPALAGKPRGTVGPAAFDALPEAAPPADVASARPELAPEAGDQRTSAPLATEAPAAGPAQGSTAPAMPSFAPASAQPANTQPTNAQPANPAPSVPTDAAAEPAQSPGLSIASERLGQVAVQLNGGADQLHVAMQAQPAAAALIGGEGQRLQQDLAAAGVVLAGLSVNGQRADLSGSGRRAPRQPRAGIDAVAGPARTRAATAPLLSPAHRGPGGVTIDRLA